jgi:acyl-CoA synthetase (AMP-forming)/AMP-acid ligase II
MLLAHGVPAAVVERFNPPEAISLFRRHGVTISAGGPAFYLAFLNEQRKDPAVPVVPSLRALFGGGAPKPAGLYWDVRRELGIPVLHGYGSTEYPLVSCGGPDDTDDQLATTEGRVVDGCEVRVTAPNPEHGEVVDGEILLRGTMLCRGYTDEVANREVFDSDGFFHTGDLGHLRADRHLVITGRAKDLIIRKSENINPVEIEEILQRHPKVHAVAVVGLPDGERGERVCAVVELRSPDEALGFVEMQEHCRAEGLTIQKTPEQLEVVEALPRNPNMKVLKTALREQLAQS